MLQIFCFLAFLALLVPAAMAAAPSVGNITATDPITLIENSTATVTCNSTITDTDGFADVSSVNATFWDPAETTENGAANNTNRYFNSTCSLSGGSGNTTNAVCSFSVQYYANPAEWTCKLNATDSTNLTGTSNITTITVNQLKAIDVSSALAFGTLALGANSSELNITVTNTGNAEVDISLDGYGASDGDGNAMACTLGGAEIPLANLRYNLTAGQDFDANMTPLTDSAVTLANFNLARTTDGTASTKNVFWKLRVPSTNVGGSCTGTVVVTAV